MNKNRWMGKLSVFQYSTYQSYLNDTFMEAGVRSGLKTKVSRAAGMHTTYLSQILCGKAQISLEQAESIAGFLDLTEEETDFFLLLILKDRAGTSRLKKRFEKQIQEKMKDRTAIKKRILSSTEITKEDRTKFYSSVIYSIIHVLVSIPQFQKKDHLANALKMTLRKLEGYLNDLIKMGVVIEKNGNLQHGTNHVHLDHLSPLIKSHHTNWRIHTISQLDKASANHTHYSGNFSLSEKDVEKMRENLLAQLKSNLDIVKESKEETAYVYSFDFYPLVET